MGSEAPRDAAGQLDLVVIVGDEVAVHPLPPSGQLRIGRAPDSDVRIDDASVSRRHAVLHVGPPLRIEDLGSANGTSVRDPRERPGTAETHRIRRRPGETLDVAVGDCIVLGSTIAVIRRCPAGTAPGGAGRLSAPSAEVVVRDRAMQALHAQAERAAQGTISVLLLGETGAGKEVLAREIHRRSPRAAGPFLALHCAALSESLLEGELFGYERGAFTGAIQARPGLFEAADRGTVLLDEIGELPMGVQVKLLRVLEERAVLRIGSRTPRSIDVRFIAATHRDLEAEAGRGAFRQDLLFRLNGMTLTIPPLRERVGEIGRLAEVFLAAACLQLERKDAPVLSSEVLSLLERHAWPGNVRELRNVIERAVVLCGGDRLLLEHLPARIAAGPVAPAPSPEGEGPARQGPPAPPHARPSAPTLQGESMEELRAAMDALDRRRIIEALEQCGGNQTRAAEQLGISRRTLVTKLGHYELPRPRKR